MLKWNSLTGIDELPAIKEKSFQKPQVIFKHSIRCGTSSLVLNRLEKAKRVPDADFYYLDVIRNRDVSNATANTFHVHHESPQILVIKNGDCQYEDSHISINMDDIQEQVEF